MKIYVGNLPWSIDDNALKALFEGFEVSEAVVIKDRYSGRSKGFGFVTIEDDKSAKKAISEFNSKEIEGRELKVSEARPMEERAQRRESRRDSSEDEESAEPTAEEASEASVEASGE